MSDRPAVNCGNCRFLGRVYGHLSSTSVCRRNPPQLVPRADSAGFPMTKWPEVDTLRDWCGEWSPLRQDNDP